MHIWECAKARVEIDEHGSILFVGKPLIKYCPIREYSGWHSTILSEEDIRKSMNWKIKSIGLCTGQRIVRIKIPGIGYGASECLMTGMDKGIIDIGIMPCDGAGTIITSDKYVIQGIGIVMPALIQTIPIQSVISRLEKYGVIIVDKITAEINQVKGVQKAIELGYTKIGVTIAGNDCEVIELLRNIEAENNLQLLIILIHTSGIHENKEKYILMADIVHGCSSKFIRSVLDPAEKYVAKFGSILPVYAFSQMGKKVLELREQEMLTTPPLIQVKKASIKQSPFPLI